MVGAIDGRENEFEAYRAGDARFHIGIARAAHSPRLLGAVTEVQSAMTEVLDPQPTDKVFEVGGTMYNVCSACHQVYPATTGPEAEASGNAA